MLVKVKNTFIPQQNCSMAENILRLNRSIVLGTIITALFLAAAIYFFVTAGHVDGGGLMLLMAGAFAAVGTAAALRGRIVMARELHHETVHEGKITLQPPGIY